MNEYKISCDVVITFDNIKLELYMIYPKKIITNVNISLHSDFIVEDGMSLGILVILNIVNNVYIIIIDDMAISEKRIVAGCVTDRDDQQITNNNINLPSLKLLTKHNANRYNMIDNNINA
jgi:hypothetical protein